MGLQPCDALGHPLGDKALTASLPVAEKWAVVDQEFTLAAESCPEGTAAVRVILGAECAGSEVRYDAVKLTAGLGSTGGACPPRRSWTRMRGQIC